MTPIEVPEVLEWPAITQEQVDIVRCADYLLTRLFALDGVQLHSDFGQTAGAWFVRHRRRAPEEPPVDEPIGIASNTWYRMVLARFGKHYMAGQLLGGYTLGQLAHKDRLYTYAMYLANDPWPGCWMRTYIRKLGD